MIPSKPSLDLLRQTLSSYSSLSYRLEMDSESRIGKVKEILKNTGRTRQAQLIKKIEKEY